MQSLTYPPEHLLYIPGTVSEAGEKMVVVGDSTLPSIYFPRNSKVSGFLFNPEMCFCHSPV